MAKITYASLKLKTNTDVKTVDFNGNKIEVLQYLPITEKYDLVSIVLQETKEDNLYSPIRLDMLFHLFLIFSYTNITFTEKQKEDLPKLYDTLLSSGLLDIVLAAIPDEEYAVLNDYIEDYMTQDMEYNTTAAAMLKTALAEIPKHMGEATKIMNTFDASKLTEVINFAKQANANRNVE
jgi:hypothetical protein